MKKKKLENKILQQIKSLIENDTIAGADYTNQIKYRLELLKYLKDL